jgi:hypothetical protein
MHLGDSNGTVEVEHCLCTVTHTQLFHVESDGLFMSVSLHDLQLLGRIDRLQLLNSISGTKIPAPLS